MMSTEAMITATLTLNMQINEKKDHGNKGKQHALKPSELKAESFIHARCKSSDKAKWKLAADKEGLKLTEWIIKTLNANSTSRNI